MKTLWQTEERVWHISLVRGRQGCHEVYYLDGLVRRHLFRGWPGPIFVLGPATVVIYDGTIFGRLALADHPILGTILVGIPTTTETEVKR